MGRVWEQPWLESEVRLGALLPADISIPVWAERGLEHLHMHMHLYSRVCANSQLWVERKPPVSSSAPAWKETEAGLWGERAG